MATKAPTVQQKFSATRRELAAALIERDEEIDLVLVALICQEHPLLVGPPGTAKSLLLDSVMKWAGTARGFSILLTKFSTPEEVFGPVSVTGLKSDRYERITTGKLPEADFAFCDEIFKASSAILNTMLRILNERLYQNGDGTFHKVPLKLCVAASNEWPQDQEGGKELGALFDRFLFRKKVRPVSSRAGRQRLLWAENLTPKLSTTITPEEIDEAHKRASALIFSPEAQAAFGEILDTLNREGIRPGDRRLRKSVMACRAFAWLNGSGRVEPEHLEVLAHTLWDDPQEQPEKVAKVVARIANPIGMKTNDLLIQAEDVVRSSKPSDQVVKLEKVIEELITLGEEKPRVEAALEHVRGLLKDSYDRVLGRK
jgi:MoxR-like ATPase